MFYITGTRVRLVEEVKCSEYGSKYHIQADTEAVIILPNLPNDQHVILAGTGRNAHRAIITSEQIKSVR